MEKIVECVMNVSEGRVAATLQAITTEIEATTGAYLLSCMSDSDHHRSVISFIGNPGSIQEAAFAAVTKAVELIDLRQHHGVHPRVGAVDVIPFVPLKQVTMKECSYLARELGRKIATHLKIPVYLYSQASFRRRRKELSTIRKGGIELLSGEIQKNHERAPDFGPSRLHPTAGATIVGARHPLIAYNVYLDTTAVTIAREVAGRIRESAGGLKGIKALGFYIPARNLAQVSMNVEDYVATPLPKLFERVNMESCRLGARALSSEIVGLVPEEALPPSALAKLKLESFHSSQILEKRITEVLG